MLKIMIKRPIPDGMEEEAVALITELRTAATHQPGYISGETLRNLDNPKQLLVISIWDSDESWQAWANSDLRKQLQARISAITGTETLYERYDYPISTSDD